MSDNPTCRVCEARLDNDNWYPPFKKGGDYICKSCKREYIRKYKLDNRGVVLEKSRLRRLASGVIPMGKNRRCSQFLGVHVAEGVLQYMFKNVERMPYGNRGYDFICNNGYLIDVKSACISTHDIKYPGGLFIYVKTKRLIISCCWRLTTVTTSIRCIYG